MTRFPLTCLAVFFLLIASCVVGAQSGTSVQKNEPKRTGPDPAAVQLPRLQAAQGGHKAAG